MGKHRNYNQIKDDLNNMFEKYNQKTRVTFLDKEICILNDNLTLSGKQRKILLGIESKITDIWKENVDYIFKNVDKNYEEILKISRHNNSVNGGIECVKQGKNYPFPKGSIPWNKGKHYHRRPFTEIERLHHSEAKIGSKNPMWGHFHDEEYKKIWSDRMKNKILNGEFTPNTNNRLTHYDIEYNGITFRSSWEVLFHHNNPEYEYEKLRIPYYYKNKKHIYIVDFVNHKDKIAVEIKPKDVLKRNDKDKAKIDALTEWCKENNYTLKLIFDEDIKTMVNKTDISVFDEKTQQKLAKLLVQ